MHECLLCSSIVYTVKNPENIYGGGGCKNNGNGLAAGCELFYHKIYGYFCNARVMCSYTSQQAHGVIMTS